jgi:CubicO group peptidase (beta-lactamase class C family)
VLKRIDGPLDETVAATRPVTVRDLLTFRLGFGVPLVPPDTYPIQRAARELGLMLGPPKPQTQLSPDEWIRRLGTLPLMSQPGERWMYNTGSDVLGVLIARASGTPFEIWLEERIFEPLGMEDTGFMVPESKRARLASCYAPDAATGMLSLHDGVADSQWSSAPAFPAGRDGLVSTADDYFAFAQMLLCDGMHHEARILSASAVRLMTTDHLTPEQRASSPLLPDGAGWGFGVAVAKDWYGWDGGYGTAWRTYREEALIGILMTQRLVYPRPSGIDAAFWASPSTSPAAK